MDKLITAMVILLAIAAIYFAISAMAENAKDGANNDAGANISQGEDEQPETQDEQPETQDEQPETQDEQPETQDEQPEAQEDQSEAQDEQPETQEKSKPEKFKLIPVSRHSDDRFGPKDGADGSDVDEAKDECAHSADCKLLYAGRRGIADGKSIGNMHKPAAVPDVPRKYQYYAKNDNAFENPVYINYPYNKQGKANAVENCPANSRWGNICIYGDATAAKQACVESDQCGGYVTDLLGNVYLTPATSQYDADSFRIFKISGEHRDIFEYDPANYIMDLGLPALEAHHMLKSDVPAASLRRG